MGDYSKQKIQIFELPNNEQSKGKIEIEKRKNQRIFSQQGLNFFLKQT
jgi:hypothetical protein